MYYKLINGQNIVGVATFDNFRRFQAKHGLVIFSDVDNAQYVEVNGIYYHDDWLKLPPSNSVEYTAVEIVSIDETEYNILKEAMETEEEIVIPEEPIDDDEPEEETDITLEFVKEMKLAQVNHICSQTIERGFDITLSDNIEHHFSLTTNDQLNLITLSAMLSAGEQSIPYHADGELCVFYSALDAQHIIDCATEFKTWMITYTNSLRAYINALETIEEVSAITFGVEIPEEYQSDVLKAMINT